MRITFAVATGSLDARALALRIWGNTQRRPGIGAVDVTPRFSVAPDGVEEGALVEFHDIASEHLAQQVLTDLRDWFGFGCAWVETPTFRGCSRDWLAGVKVAG